MLLVSGSSSKCSARPSPTVRTQRSFPRALFGPLLSGIPNTRATFVTVFEQEEHPGSFSVSTLGRGQEARNDLLGPQVLGLRRTRVSRHDHDWPLLFTETPPNLRAENCARNSFTSSAKPYVILSMPSVPSELRFAARLVDMRGV